MNIADYTYLLNKPNAINLKNLTDLEMVLTEFPYFQSARSLQLKGLYAQDSFKYNNALKKTAAYTTDRTVLFDLITSPNFATFKDVQEQIENQIANMEVEQETEIVEINKLENSILSSIQSSSIPSENLKTETSLEIEKPLHFNKTETHSFQEWLQLATLSPIIRENELDENSNFATKLEIIDKFIEANPKIPAIKDNVFIPSIVPKNEDSQYLMTETLAKIYLEQKKYSKAIQAYEILILKYPEKITYFANQIAEIKILQQNNNK